MPIITLLVIACCSESRRCSSSSARFRSVMSSTIQTVPFWRIGRADRLGDHAREEGGAVLRRTSHSTSSWRPAQSTGIAIAPIAS